MKHRVDRNDAKAIWGAIKIARQSIQKQIEICPSQNDVIKYCIPDSAHQYLHFIDKHLAGTVGASGTELFGKESKTRYLIQSLMEEAITSAQLEGAVTTRKVAKELLTSSRKPVNKSEKMIVNNYLLMQSAINNKDSLLDLDLIRDLHEVATYDAIENEAEPGEFRTSNNIHVSGKDDEIVHEPPCHTLVNEYMEIFCNFANYDHDEGEFIHPVVKAIILHFLFGYIHPFGDGNGRTARAIFYWFMLKSGYWLFEYVSISKLLNMGRTSYGQSCEKCEKDVTYFIMDQLEIIKRAIIELLTHIKVKNEELYDLMNLMENSKIVDRYNFRQKIILKKAVKNPGYEFSVKWVENEFDITPATARTDLTGLVKTDVLAPTKKGKAILYIAKAGILDLLRGK